MRIALLTILACLFLVAPPAARPILCLGIAFVMSAALVGVFSVAVTVTKRRFRVQLDPFSRPRATRRLIIACH